MTQVSLLPACTCAQKQRIAVREHFEHAAVFNLENLPNESNGVFQKRREIPAFQCVLAELSDDGLLARPGFRFITAWKSCPAVDMSCCVAIIAERRSASPCNAPFARFASTALLLLRNPSRARLLPLLLGRVVLRVSSLASLLLRRFIDGFFKIPAAKQELIEQSRISSQPSWWRHGVVFPLVPDGQVRTQILTSVVDLN